MMIMRCIMVVVMMPMIVMMVSLTMNVAMVVMMVSIAMSVIMVVMPMIMSMIVPCHQSINACDRDLRPRAVLDLGVVVPAAAINAHQITSRSLTLSSSPPVA